MKQKIISVLSLFLPLLAQAEWVPTHADEIIAEWPLDRVPTTVSRDFSATGVVEIFEEIDQALRVANQPGQAYRYSRVESIFQALPESEQSSVRGLFVHARIDQYQHQFSGAIKTLRKLILQQPKHISAHLLLARLYTLQGDSAAAKSSCVRMIGLTDVLTIAACSSEAQGNVNARLLSQIENMIIQQGWPNDDRAIWLAQILAEGTMQTGRWDVASQWLDAMMNRRAPATLTLSFLAQWSDIQLVLNEPQRVIDVLGPIVSSNTDKDDALLLRLAIAESSLGMSSYWTDIMSDRVALREQRNDQLHASEMARFYLEIEKDISKAERWANINWQKNKSYEDERLLSLVRNSLAQSSVEGFE
ncbi:hypothetical protein [Thalassolituus sp.]|jgi:hypothetical protein|uniref:tetratricopeptide repeat protein n=1 Tax=Thalassolituus sp. TaxID=2030822 RepID=UPI002A7EB68D|nr:hypothetical protein [Thalassolituus sp.]